MADTDDAVNKAFDDEYGLIEEKLETEPYVVRHYLVGTGPVAAGFLDLFMKDETGDLLERLFCNYDIQGKTIAIHATVADMLTLLYDEESYYDESGEKPSFAAFALANGRSPYQKKGEKVLYVDIICTSKDSRDAKKRYGEAMLKSLEALAKEKNIDAVEVDALDSAVGFYEKMGYVKMGEGEDGTVMRKTLKTGGSRLRLKTLRRSHTKEKKWDAVFEQDGKTKVVPFGQKGYSDFTKHKDTKRRQRYIDRHSGMGEDWTDPTTPGALSRYILWNKKTLRASLRDFKKKFHV